MKAYEAWVTKKRHELNSTTSPPSSRDAAMLEAINIRVDPLWEDGRGDGSIMWLGNPETATKFVLFFHGGGFICPLNLGHVEWCYQTYILPSSSPSATSVKAAAPDVAVAILEYSLTPGATYPTQFSEASRSLELVLTHLRRRGISPSTNLVVGGDSAGGNLAALLVRHILTPHPGVEPITLSAGESIAGVFLVSPFLHNGITTSSYKDNENLDMIHGPWLENITNLMIRPRKDLPKLSKADLMKLACPLQGDLAAWMPKLDSIVGSLYVTAGGLESFRDHIVQFADEVKKQCPKLKVRFDLTDREVHDHILVEAASMHFGDAMRRMEEWTTGTLKLE